MRILLVISSLGIGGAERQVTALARELGRRHEVELLTIWDAGPLAAELEGSSVTLRSLGRRGRLDLTYLPRLAAHVRRCRPDVLYAWLPQVNLASLVARAARPATRLVWSVVDAGLAPEGVRLDSRLVHAIEPRLAALAHAIVTNSTAGNEHALTRGFPVAKLRLVPNGIDVARFSPPPGARERLRAAWGLGDRTLVGVVARLHPIKDHPTFLRAAALASSSRPELGFVLVGGGEPDHEAALRRLAAELRLEDRVVFAGPRGDVAEVLSSLDVAALTSVAEGFPNAVGEAMAAGLPCVVTDVGDCAHMVGDSGVVCPRGDAEAIARALVHLADLGPDGRAALGRAARARVDRLFSVQAMADRTEQVFQELGPARSPGCTPRA